MPEWTVPSEDSGKKLISFLVERLENYSARSLKRLLESNCCQINGRTERFASIILAKGDYITLKVDERASSSSTHAFTEEPSRVLYEDNCLLIYNKPSGVSCDPTTIAKLFSSRQSLILVHRLDRDTTGVLILAKDKSILDQMILAFKELKVQKRYFAIVDGILEKKEGLIDNFLVKKHAYDGQAIWGAGKEEKGVSAKTSWKKILEGNNASLIECVPYTGRTHQIRVHMAGLRHPVLGDYQYSKSFRCSYHPKRHLLHAYQIQFQHPVSGKMVDVRAPLPSDFLEAQHELFGTKKQPLVE